MGYYKDSTYYSFQHFENAINIGWITESDKTQKGQVSKEFLKKLEEYLPKRFNTIRENVNCNLCKCNSYKTLISNQKITLGYSEIRVISEDGKKRYASPDLIYHYITDHRYIPPIKFIEAVLNGPKPSSEKYQIFSKRYKEEFLWGENEKTVKTIEEIENQILSEDIQAEKTIVENPNLIHLVTKNGSLLNVAIKAKNLKMIRFLLEFPTIEINKFSGIELISAISTFDNDLIKLLLSKKIKIDLTTIKNPLFTSISIGNIDAVRTLIEHGIDFEIEYSNPFMKNMNAIRFAHSIKQESIANLLEIQKDLKKQNEQP